MKEEREAHGERPASAASAYRKPVAVSAFRKQNTHVHAYGQGSDPYTINARVLCAALRWLSRPPQGAGAREDRLPFPVLPAMWTKLQATSARTRGFLQLQGVSTDFPEANKHSAGQTTNTLQPLGTKVHRRW